MTPPRRSQPVEDRPGRVSPTAPESQSLSAAVWKHLESQQGFNEAMEEGIAQIASGDSTTLKEWRRRR